MNAKYANVVRTNEVIDYIDTLSEELFDLPSGKPTVFKALSAGLNPGKTRPKQRRVYSGWKAENSAPKRLDRTFVGPGSAEKYQGFPIFRLRIPQRSKLSNIYPCTKGLVTDETADFAAD
jgi:hypothetical protein